MAPRFWIHDHAFMDAMRTKMDPLADTVIEQLFAEGSVDGVNQLMRTLVGNDELPSSGLPPYVRQYLARTEAVVARLDFEKVRQGQALFELFGPKVVLCRTGFLQRLPVRRIFETAQMVVDVMTEGGLEPGGRGVRTLQKVRLMHAAVRHMIRHDAKQPWDARELGEPLNQEDLAGTLMTFSYVVLEGMKALHIQLTPEQQEAWLYAWVAVGRILGVDPRLLPASVDEARQLTLLIRQRQVAYSEEGVAMTASLIDGLSQFTPDIPFSIPRHLQERWARERVARSVVLEDVPAANTDSYGKAA
jgi:hypothetical protein